MKEASSCEVSEVVGSLGRHQVLSLLCNIYLMAVSGCCGVFVQFLAPEVSISWTGEEGNNVTLRSSQCTRHQLPRANNATTLTYFTPYSTSTLTQKLGLVCEDSWLVSLSNSVIMMGAVIWTLIFGQISERYGRRKVILGLTVPIVAASLCILLTDNFPTFILACFVYGGASFSINNAAFVTVVELCSVRLRPVIGCMSMFGIILGQALMALAAWALHHWFYMQLAQLVFASLSPFVVWYMLESPVWLAVKGRDEEARQVLRRIAKRNGIRLATAEPKMDLWLHGIKRKIAVQMSLAQDTFWDLFKTRTITAYTLSASFILFSTWLVFFGLSMNVESFGSDLYQDLLISNGLAILSNGLVILGLLAGLLSVRQTCYACSLLLTVVSFLYPFLYAWDWARSTLSGLARFVSSPPMSTAVIYAAEIFPTSVRSSGFAFATMVARIGATASPFLREIGVKGGVYVPFVVFGVLGLSTTLLLVLVLPETRGKPLAQTIRDLHNDQRMLLNEKPSFFKRLLAKL